jgi:hypothetical protein
VPNITGKSAFYGELTPLKFVTTHTTVNRELECSRRLSIHCGNVVPAVNSTVQKTEQELVFALIIAHIFRLSKARMKQDGNVYNSSKRQNN